MCVFLIVPTCWQAGRSRSPGWWKTEPHACWYPAAPAAAAWSPQPRRGAQRRRACAALGKTWWRGTAAQWAVRWTQLLESEGGETRQKNTNIKVVLIDKHNVIVIFGNNSLEYLLTSPGPVCFSPCMMSTEACPAPPVPACLPTCRTPSHRARGTRRDHTRRHLNAHTLHSSYVLLWLSHDVMTEGWKRCGYP